MNTANPTAIMLYSVVMTAVVMIVLVVAGILPLWVAAVIILADAALTWFITSSMRSRT